MKSINARRNALLGRGFIIRLGVFAAVAVIAAVPFYTVLSHSAIKRAPALETRPVVATRPLTKVNLPGSQLLPQPKGKNSRSSVSPASMPVTESIATFASDCSTPKTDFAVGDTVCVSTSGFPINSFFPAFLILANANSTVIFSAAIVSDPQTNSFVLPATSTIGGNTIDNRGSWHAIVLNPFFFFPEAATTFSLADPQNKTADSAVATAFNTGDVQAGAQVIYQLQVKNYGPDSSLNLQLTDAVPAGTTFVSFQQVSGPTFVCSNPDEGATGTTTCTIDSLAWPGPEAVFLAIYKVDDNATTNTLVVNTASISSDTDDENPLNSSTSATSTVVNAGGGSTCSFDCPANIVTTATSQSGAIVNFGSAQNIQGSCGAISASPASGSLFPIGTTVVNVSSDAGPTCSFTVTVSDTPAPTISCPPNKDATADQTGTATVDVGTPSTTPSTGVTVTFERSDGASSLTDPFPTGVTGITWTVTDSIGRTATCNQTVTVHPPCASDTQPPTITAPPDITVGTGSGSTSCNAEVENLGTPNAQDDCSVTVTASGIPPGNLFPVGTTTITYTATDGAGHTATATQHVTVNDDTPPVIAAPADASYTCPEQVPAADPSQAHGTDPNLPNGGPVFDNCGVQSVTVSQSTSGAGTAANPRIITRTFTATDIHGNTASAVQTITVTDSTPPTITAPAAVTAFTGPGATSCDTVVSNATLGTASAQDNCAGVSVSRSPSGNTFPVGTTTVTWTATDWAGNTATATQTITVVDNTPPVVTPPANVTAFTGPGATSCGTVVSDATLGSASATDNCPGVSGVTRTGVPAGNAFPVGTTTVTYSATDAHGNSASATQTVTVIDNTPPVISCPANITLEPTCPSGAIATFATPSATDNCAVQSVTRTAGLASGSVFPIGTSTVTFTATDVHGNSASCSFTVTVKTAAAVVQDLITRTQALQPPLTGPQTQGLVSKLNQALTSINSGSYSSACGKLGDYVTQVQNYINNGTISAAQGQPLINSANKVRNTIGCTNNPCT